MGESVIRTTVAVANSHTSIPPPLEMVDGKELPPSSPEAHLRTRIPVRNRSECVDSQQEFPNPFLREPSLWNPPQYTEGCILRNAPSIKTPQMALMKEKCRIQNRSGGNQNKPMAVLADPFAWQGFPHSTGQMTNTLFHLPGCSPSDTPELWDNGQS